MSPVEMPPLPVDDLYAVLELTPEATEEAIRASYRRLARLRHPDKNPSDPNATARFQLVGGGGGGGALCD
jgi:curved DNA-binding protein CbpA